MRVSPAGWAHPCLPVSPSTSLTPGLLPFIPAGQPRALSPFGLLPLLPLPNQTGCGAFSASLCLSAHWSLVLHCFSSTTHWEKFDRIHYPGETTILINQRGQLKRKQLMFDLDMAHGSQLSHGQRKETRKFAKLSEVNSYLEIARMLFVPTRL